MNLEIATTLVILGGTFLMISTGVCRVDVVAMLALIALGIVAQAQLLTFPGAELLIFAGFGSSAVMALLATMIIAAGLDRAGVMSEVAHSILRTAGDRPIIIMATTCVAAALFSSVMQNAAAAALFLPVISGIRRATGINVRFMLLPVGSCIILGGNLSMIGSSPLIMLNGLLDNQAGFITDQSPSPLATFPAGCLLLALGILFYCIVWPRTRTSGPARGDPTEDDGAYIRRVYQTTTDIIELHFSAGAHPAAGITVGELEQALEEKVRVVAVCHHKHRLIAPPRHTRIEAPCTIAVIGSEEMLRSLETRFEARRIRNTGRLRNELSPARTGFSELVITPESAFIGRTVRQLRLRTHYGLNLVVLYRNGQPLHDDAPYTPLRAGDYLLCHGSWSEFHRLKDSKDVLLVSTNLGDAAESIPKARLATAIAITTFVAAVLASHAFALVLLSGAMAMVLSRVVSMDEAYTAISWRTVLLLAGLMPLGMAVQESGTASWLAGFTVGPAGNYSHLVLHLAIAAVTSALALLISNVGATAVMVPIVANLAVATGMDPVAAALNVGVSASNALLLPTHPVNALIQGPGGYRVRDFVKLGTPVTIGYITVTAWIFSAW